eukprot:GAHX01008273.1.p2 GENE.GAHX01008273.1~~GAHX01008273.1.p2  ORF type:complete len:82 (+),score=9.50 GAHX01008273.1:51-296(+)
METDVESVLLATLVTTALLHAHTHFMVKGVLKHVAVSPVIIHMAAFLPKIQQILQQLFPQKNLKTQKVRMEVLILGGQHLQ